MRPRYETKDNRAAQERVMKRLCAIKGKGWEYEMTPPLTAHDARLWNGDDSRLYEVKVRFRRFDEYPTLMITARKLDDIMETAQGGPWGIVADFYDGVFVGTWRKLPADSVVRKGGRTKKRRDGKDKEDCHYIPNRHFDRVCDTVNHKVEKGGLFDDRAGRQENPAHLGQARAGATPPPRRDRRHAGDGAADNPVR